MKKEKKYFKFSISFLLAFLICIKAFPQETRQKILFNEGWKFYKGEVKDADKVNFNDQSWRSVDLPHDWSIEGPFSEEWASGTGYLPGGIGWYRKAFQLNPNQRGKNHYIYFDGVYKNSEVWVNGKLAGKRPNGFVSFYYDITKFLNPEGKNVVAVRADHTDFGDCRWYAGSGIYRNVYLISVDPVHIPLWGIAFTTSQVSEEKATAQVAVSVKNLLKDAKNVLVKCELVDAQKKVVAQAEKPLNILPGKDIKANLSFELNRPALWSIDNPNLYELRVSLSIAKKNIDEVVEQVGFRSFRFDANEGFFLNGKNLKLKGVCLHDDAGALGNAVPKDVWERRLKTLKEMGCNSIRMSHNPHQDYFYDLCDKMGFLVQDEAFDEWEIGKNKWIKGWNVGQPGKDGYNKYFKEWSQRDVTDMILRNRNHASIFMWSIGNEIDYPNDPYTHEVLNTGKNPQIYGSGYSAGNPPAQRLGALSKQLVLIAKKADSTRYITAALAGVVMSNFTDYPEALDLVGYNYQEYRYYDDHKKYPKRIIYGSENGKSYDAWTAVDTTPYISAQYLWTGIDYLGEARSWPSRSNGAGLIDLAGFPKPEYYYRQSLWSEKPMIYMGSAKLSHEADSRPWQRRVGQSWNWKTGDSVKVSCYTNCTEAELFINGKSLGRKTLAQGTQKIISWDVVYQSGDLLVKGFRDGKEIAQMTLKSAGEPVLIKATTDRKILKANKDDVAHIEIQIADSKETPCYDSENEVEIEVTGPGRLIGLESGSLTSHEDYKANKRKAVHGKLLAYIQAQKPGIIKLTVKSLGLQSKTIEIIAE